MQLQKAMAAALVQEELLEEILLTVITPVVLAFMVVVLGEAVGRDDRRAALAQFALFGPEQLASSLQQTQVICDGTIYSNSQ